jgi:hypothetical protein
MDGGIYGGIDVEMKGWMDRGMDEGMDEGMYGGIDVEMKRWLDRGIY